MTLFAILAALICLAVFFLLWLAEPVVAQPHYRRRRPARYHGRHFATVPKRSLVPLPVRRYAAAVVAAQYFRYRLAMPMGAAS
jgi:hypothetical protein